MEENKGNSEQINFEELNLSPLVRDKNLYDFVVLDSRLLHFVKNESHYKEIIDEKTGKVEKVVFLGTRGMLHEGFKKIEPMLLSLALKGCDKAISRYLFLEEVDSWNQEVVQRAREIEKLQVKTPEQWEIVAHLHLADEVNVSLGDEIFSGFQFEAEKLGVRNMKDLFYQIRQYYNMFNESENEYHHGRYQDLYTGEILDKEAFVKRVERYYNRFIDLSMCMMNQCPEFVKAVRQAQVGYYARYFKGNKDILDLSSFMSLKERPYSLLLPVGTLKSIVGGKQLFNEHYGKLLKKDFKRLRRIKTLDAMNGAINGYAVINGVDKIEGSGGFVDIARVGRKDRMTLSFLANKATTEEKPLVGLKGELVH